MLLMYRKVAHNQLWTVIRFGEVYLRGIVDTQVKARRVFTAHFGEVRPEVHGTHRFRQAGRTFGSDDKEKCNNQKFLKEQEKSLHNVRRSGERPLRYFISPKIVAAFPPLASLVCARHGHELVGVSPTWMNHLRMLKYLAEESISQRQLHHRGVG